MHRQPRPLKCSHWKLSTVIKTLKNLSTEKLPEKIVRYEAPDGECYYYAAAKVPTGDWSLLMRVREDEVLDPLYTTLIKQSGASLLIAGLLIVALVCLVNTMVKPISDAYFLARKVAGGDLTVRPGKCANNEAGELLQSIGSMTRQFEQCRKAGAANRRTDQFFIHTDIRIHYRTRGLVYSAVAGSPAGIGICKKNH